MTIYRLEGILHPSVKLISKIVEEEPPRYRRAFVDPISLECLNRLVTGPITSLSQLRAAELAARSIVFHDDVHLLIPGIKLTHVASLDASPFEMSQGILDPEITEIEELLKDANYRAQLITIDRVTTFGSEEIKTQYLENYERQKSEQARRDKDLVEKGITPGIDLVNVHKGNFVPVCDSIDQLYGDVFLNSTEQISNYLTPVPETGSPAYIGEQVLDTAYGGRPKDIDYRAFLSGIDKNWVERLDKHANYALRIPLGFMIAIALSESATRDELPTVLLQLRQEFREAREQLWTTVDDAFLRSVSETDVARLIDNLEGAINEIIPAAFKANNYWFPLRISYLKRLFMLDWLGLLDTATEDIESVIQSKTSKLHMIDAAGLLVDHIKQIDNLTWLLQRHFSSLEIESLKTEIEI